MAQVHGQQSDREDVEAAHEGTGEGGHNYAIDIVPSLGIDPGLVFGVEGFPSELGEMVNYKGQNGET